jgi:hypothetical protein
VTTARDAPTVTTRPFHDSAYDAYDEDIVTRRVEH